MLRMPHWTRASTALIILATVAGCTAQPLQTPPQALGDRDISERTPDSAISRQDALNFFREQPVTVLQTGEANAFKLTTETGSQVPRVPVQRVNAAPMAFAGLLAQIAEQVGMSWSITGEGRDALLVRPVYYVQRNETMLETVLEELSRSTNSFYRIDGDKIVFEQDRQFTTSIPRYAGSRSTIESGLRNAGATNVFSDEVTGALTFRANRQTYHSVIDLMKTFQSGRDMIVYDFWVIDRVLNDNSGAGARVEVNQARIGSPSEGGRLENIVSGGPDSASFQTNLGALDINATLRFIRSLGQAETVARPTISMLSGGRSDFRAGEASEYIRSIEGSSTGGSGTTTSSSSTDVRTLETGVGIQVEGSHNAGVISSAIQFDLTELLEFQNFDTGEVTLQLPRTSERKITAHMEARPGDVMVIGGIIRDRQDKGQRNVGATSIPSERTASSSKTETIILMRPRLVQIRPSGAASVQVPQKYGNVVGDVIAEESKVTALIGSMNKGK